MDIRQFKTSAAFKATAGSPGSCEEQPILNLDLHVDWTQEGNYCKDQIHMACVKGTKSMHV